MAEVGDTAEGTVGGPIKRLLARGSKLQEMQLLLQTQGQTECLDTALSPIFWLHTPLIPGQLVSIWKLLSGKKPRPLLCPVPCSR